jgi:hypothetical protein
MIQNKDLNKWNLYEKRPLNSLWKNKIILKKIHYLTKKIILKKYYRYNILLYKSINYEDKKDSFIYELPFQLNNKQEIFIITE